MTDSAGIQIGALLRDALNLAEPARQQWLRELESKSPEQARQVRALLNENSMPSTKVMQMDVSNTAATRTLDDTARIGPYRLLRLLGQGGMGEVWLAERADAAYSKKVAIKFIATFLGNRDAIAWFRRERQALATLDHPNIARLLDGGETDDGRPYLVMEYVDGVAIDSYCDGLGLEKILELFLQVCAAVDHAHRALIVHRDIKPANVLVTGDGQSKLLDFGIAKEIELGAANDNQTKTQAFTLHYASPEQMTGQPITVASDIYSLGALLYRLLSGRLLHSQATNLHSQLQAIETTSPDKPSRAVLMQTGGDESERKKRARKLQGDLDDIVLKCLRHEPAARYGSARELIEDIQRYQAHEPVTARRGNFSYRATRWARRNWLGVAAGVALLLTFAGGFVSTVWQARLAEQQRVLAQKRFDLSRALVKDLLFDFQDRLASVPGTVDARRQLISRAQVYLKQLAVDAQNDPDLLIDLTVVERRLGDISGNPSEANIGDTAAAREHYQRAEQFVRRAIELRPKDEKLQLELARTLSSRAYFLFWDNNLLESEKTFKAAIPIFEKFVNKENTAKIKREHAAAVIGLGDVYFWTSQLKLSLSTYQSVCTEITQSTERTAAALDAKAVCHTRLADSFAWLEQYDKSEAEIAQAIAIYSLIYAKAPDNLDNNHSYVVALIKQGEIALWAKKQEIALGAYSQALTISMKTQAADPQDLRAARDVAMLYKKKGDALVDMKRIDEAIADYKRGLQAYEILAKQDPTQLEHQRDIAISYRGLGIASLMIDDKSSAALYLDRSLAIMRERWTKSPKEVAARRDLAIALEDRIAVPDSEQRRCILIKENLGLWLQLKQEGILTPGDEPQLAQAERRGKNCRLNPLPP